jgi:hypothetical protein
MYAMLTAISFVNPMIRQTLQCSEARVISRFGWGLAKRIESLGVTRFKSHLEKA